jgi:hypothetical protein
MVIPKVSARHSTSPPIASSIPGDRYPRQAPPTPRVSQVMLAENGDTVIGYREERWADILRADIAKKKGEIPTTTPP